VYVPTSDGSVVDIVNKILVPFSVKSIMLEEAGEVLSSEYVIELQDVIFFDHEETPKRDPVLVIQASSK
jgi:hypothetical protein